MKLNSSVEIASGEAPFSVRYQQGIYSLLPWLVFTAALVATFLLWRHEHNESAARQQASFDFHASEAQSLIERRMAAYEQLLRSTAGLFDASNNVVRKEFHDFIARTELNERYPGIQGLGFSLIVPASDKRSHIAAIRKQGFADYTIRPEGRRDFYTSTVYLEPFSGRNLRAFGYDMWSEPVHRAAMELARDSRQPAISGKVRLVQETEAKAQAGFLMYLPIYKKGVKLGSVAERRANILGWVYAPFRMPDLMHGIYGGHTSMVDLEIYDGAELTAKTLMSDADEIPDSLESAHFKAARHLSIAGHHWTLTIRSTPLFEQMQGGQEAEYLIGGLSISLLLTWITGLLTSGRARALAVARQMTNELRESETRYRQMFEDNTSVAYLIDPATGSIVDVNVAAVDFWGYSREELRHMNIADINTASPEAISERMSQVKSGLLHHLEWQHRLKNGEIRDVEVYSGPVDYHGRKLLYSIVHDNTARKHAEQALSDENYKNQLLLRTAGEGIHILDMQGNVVQANDAFCQMLGYTQEEIFGMNVAQWDALLPQEKLQENLDAVVSKSGGMMLETRHRRKDGNIIDVEVSVASVDIHNRIYLYCASRDITKRKQSERALQESEQRFRDIVNTTDGIVWEADATTVIFTFVSQQAERLLGYTTEEWKQPGFWVDHLHPDDREWAPEYCANCSNRLEPHDFEYRFISKDGRTVWLRDMVTVVAEDGKPRWLRGIMVDVTAQKEFEARLTHEKLLLRTLIDSIPDIIFFKDKTGTYLGCNKACEKIMGTPEQAIVGKTDFDFFDAETAAFFTKMDREMLLSGKTHVNEEWLTYPDSHEVCLETLKTPYLEPGGQPVGLIGISRDITERRQREEELERASIVFESVDNGVFITDPDNRFISVNPAFTRITGYTEEDVVGKNPAILSSHQHSREFFDEMRSTLASAGVWNGEVINRRKDGEIYVEWLSITVVRNSQGKITYHVAIFSDITTRKEAEARVQHLAHYDVLTDLPNRALLTDRLHQALAKAQRDNTKLAVMFLDLDQFKPVNDTLGHDMGDLLLRKVAERLQSCVPRESDTVSRFGGDEFVVLLQTIEGNSDAEIMAEKILSSLTQPFDLSGHAAQISTSIGIAIYPEHGDDAEQLGKNADAAMYQAKQEGRGRFKVYTAEM